MAVGWSEQSIAETQFRIFRPSNPHEHGATIFFLHDEDQSLPLRNEAIERLLDERQLTVVAPACGPVWSLDVETDRGLIRDYLVEKIFPAALDIAGEAAGATQESPANPRLALMGEGMGGQAMLRVAYDYPGQFPIVAAVDPKVDFHLHVRQGHEVLSQQFEDEESARQHTPILHVHPLNWPRHHYFCADPMHYPWFDGADRLRQKLGASGIQFECELERSAEDEEVSYFEIMAETVIDFCVKGLERERLRVV